MKSSFSRLYFISILVLSSVVIADTPLIWTTIADSSNVSFIAKTPLDWEIVDNNNLRFIRFTETPVTDSIGYPELPMITCLVAVPDSVHPNIEYSFSDEQQLHILPVYPTPDKVFSTSYCTESIVDLFYQDSTAYTLTDFWPSERVRLIGETRICDQRLLKIQLFPALYRASV